MAAPTNLLIQLDWNSVDGATSYNLKRGTTSNGPYPTIISDLTTTNYSDANVTNGVNYYYVVTALGEGGESTNSLQVSAAPLPSDQPANLNAQVNNGQLQLSWPQDHLGWRLQTQTNPLSTGLSANWVTVPNSTNVNSAVASSSTRQTAPYFSGLFIPSKMKLTFLGTLILLLSANVSLLCAETTETIAGHKNQIRPGG